MKILSPLFTAASGQLGNTTASTSGNVVTIRAKAAAVSTSTTTAATGTSTSTTDFANVSLAWSKITAAQRTAWNTLATQVTLTNTLGTSYKPSGQQLFISCNTNLKSTSQPTISDPPASPTSPPGFPSLSFSVIYAGSPPQPQDLNISASSAYTGAQIILSTTKQLKATQFYAMGKSVKKLEILAGLDDGNNPFGDVFEAKYGQLQLGAGIGIQLVAIDANGFAGPPAQMSLVVTG